MAMSPRCARSLWSLAGIIVSGVGGGVCAWSHAGGALGLAGVAAALVGAIVRHGSSPPPCGSR